MDNGTIVAVGFLIFVIVAGLLSLAIYANYKNKLRNENSKPLCTTMATIVNIQNLKFNEQFVMFELQDGQRMQLLKKNDNNLLLCQGDRGIVGYKGQLLISFERRM